MSDRTPPAQTNHAVRGILLAAGSSTRFGGFKLMHAIEGEPMVLKSAKAMKTALGAVLVAVRAESPCLPTLSWQEGIDILECSRAVEGMGGSLAQVVAALPVGTGGYVIALADMPFIEPQSIRAVADALRGGASLAAPVYRGERGHPVGIAASYRAELLALQGDAGARDILARNRAAMTLVEVNDPGVLRDIDTPGDLAK